MCDGQARKFQKEDSYDAFNVKRNTRESLFDENILFKYEEDNIFVMRETRASYLNNMLTMR